MSFLNSPPDAGKGQNAAGKYREVIRRITVSAVFLSIALVLKLTVSFYLPFMGAAGIKIDFSGIFTVFPAFLFGPLYGGAVCAAADLLAAVIKPNGAYIPWLTVTAFASGFLCGLAWLLIKRFYKAHSKTAFAVAALILAMIFAFGAAGHMALNSDGIMNGLYTDSSTLPRKGELAAKKLSPLSRFITDIAKYTNDTLTLDLAFSEKTAEITAAYIPDKADSFGSDCKITAIGENAFHGCINLNSIFIPASVRSIGENAFKDCPNVVIYAPEGSNAESCARSRGNAFIASDYSAFAETFTECAAAGSAFTPSDTYRPYLASMINLLTLGVEIITLFGAFTLTIGYMAAGRENDEKCGGYLKVFTAIFIPRFIITTINTEILRVFIGAWNGRSFIILWIPRALEEIIGCVIQAYIIMLLLNIYVGKIMPRMK